MNRRIEAIAINEKLFIATVGDTRLAVLPLNGSATFFPKPWEDLSHLVNILDLPDHPESAGQPLKIDSIYIIEILGIEKPTPEEEARLTAVLSGDTIIDTAGLPVQARTIKFHLGQTPMAAALVDLADAPITCQIPSRLLIITDLPSN